jgi:hypothetical protein
LEGQVPGDKSLRGVWARTFIDDFENRVEHARDIPLLRLLAREIEFRSGTDAGRQVASPEWCRRLSQISKIRDTICD